MLGPFRSLCLDLPRFTSFDRCSTAFSRKEHVMSWLFYFFLWRDHDWAPLGLDTLIFSARSIWKKPPIRDTVSGQIEHILEITHAMNLLPCREPQFWAAGRRDQAPPGKSDRFSDHAKFWDSGNWDTLLPAATDPFDVLFNSFWRPIHFLALSHRNPSNTSGPKPFETTERQSPPGRSSSLLNWAAAKVGSECCKSCSCLNTLGLCSSLSLAWPRTSELKLLTLFVGVGFACGGTKWKVGFEHVRLFFVDMSPQNWILMHGVNRTMQFRQATVFSWMCFLLFF